MRIKKGIPVSPGVAICRAVVLDAVDVPIPRRTLQANQIPAELERLEKALDASDSDIRIQRQQAESKLGPELAKIFDSHAGLIRDKSLTDQFVKMIETDKVTAEYAVYRVMRHQAQLFGQMENRYLRERVSDIWDLEKRIIGQLIGHQRIALDGLSYEAIIIAHDLTPSQTAALDRSKIKGIATDVGGRTSHTAILAHAQGIPAIVGLEDITSDVNDGDMLILDANNGQVIINPDAAELLEYRQYAERINKLGTSLDELRELPAKTVDGTEISLCCNIEFPQEIDAALAKGAVGVGLYRTEFLFLASETEPTQDEQYASYVDALERLGGLPLTIRTLDLGADKLVPGEYNMTMESNPFLGCRSIRLCLQNLPLFKSQLRAILRASAKGPLRIMFPLISNIMELRQAKMILNDVMEDLDDENIPFDRKIPVGIMIEVPSAAIQAKTLAREVDFFSIGTNDLIQYTVAVDRGNERIASLYSSAHPAVIQLVKDVIRAANRAKIEVSLCGEMAGEPEYVMLLVGLGLRSLSITPPAVPEVKRVIRSVSIAQCQRLARKVGAMETDREVTNFVRDELRKVLPEIYRDRRFES